MARTDTVGTNFYKPVVDLDRAGTLLFWLIATLSVVPLIIDKVAYPDLHQATQIVLLVLAIVFFVQGQFQRLYLFPRAEDARRQQLLSDSYNVALSHETTQGYYNNDQTNPLKRLSASTFESALFTKSIVRKMLHRVRVVTLIYFCAYIALVSYRGASLDWVAVMAQVLFGEEIIVRWLRMEWLRKRTEEIYDGLNRLFLSKQLFSKPTTQSQAIDLVTTYESSKSTAAVVLSSKIFQQSNPVLSREWDDIRRRLVI